MTAFRASLITIFTLMNFTFPSAQATSLIAGAAYESIPLKKSGMDDETFQSFPITLAVQIFPTSMLDRGIQALGWLGLAYDSSKGDQSTQKKAWNVQLGGGMKWNHFYLRGAIHLGSFKLTTPATGELSYSDRGGHIGIAYELPLSRKLALQFEVRKVLFSLYGDSNSVFGNAYSGDYWGGLFAVAYNL